MQAREGACGSACVKARRVMFLSRAEPRVLVARFPIAGANQASTQTTTPGVCACGGGGIPIPTKPRPRTSARRVPGCGLHRTIAAARDVRHRVSWPRGPSIRREGAFNSTLDLPCSMCRRACQGFREPPPAQGLHTSHSGARVSAAPATLRGATCQVAHDGQCDNALSLRSLVA